MPIEPPFALRLAKGLPSLAKKKGGLRQARPERWRALFAALVALLIAAPAQAEAWVLPPLTGRVVDMANLLSPAQEAALTRRLAALERRTSDQLVIVTTPSLGGRSIEEYGLRLGNGWHVGRRGRDNGVLLIVAPREHSTRIEVGFGLEAILTDARAAQIIQRDMLPQFRAQRWPAGIEAGTQAIIGTLIAHAREPRARRAP